jgi:hypothetical protein
MKMITSQTPSPSPPPPPPPPPPHNNNKNNVGMPLNNTKTNTAMKLVLYMQGTENVTKYSYRAANKMERCLCIVRR